MRFWANPEAYMKLVRVGEFHGPVARLYDRQTQEAIGEPTPQEFIATSMASPDWMPYTGPLDKADQEGS